MLKINKNITEFMHNNSLKLSKIALTTTLIFGINIASCDIALAKGSVSAGARGISAPKATPKTTPKTSTNTSKNISNSSSFKGYGSKKSLVVRQNSVYGNSNYIINPIYWPLFMHNNNTVTHYSDEVLTIENMTYNKSKSNTINCEIYDITFNNGVKTTAKMKVLKQKLSSLDELVYIKLEYSNVCVPVKKDDLAYWVNLCEKQNNYKTYTKRKNVR